jgi:hypothetical protein
MKELCLHSIINTETGRCFHCGVQTMPSHGDRIVELEQRVVDLEDLVCALACNDISQRAWGVLEQMRRRIATKGRGT